MIHREAATTLLKQAQQFRVLTVTGPRQSGKTTLVRSLFPTHRYVNLEDYDMRSIAIEDPRGFLQRFASEAGLIIDEVQHVPVLLSYLLAIVDQTPQPGRFVLSGSQNLLLSGQVSQSLAGRTATLTLLPLSIAELTRAHRTLPDLEEMLFRGEYPGLWQQPIDPVLWHSAYLDTYVERDVRQIEMVQDLALFRKFLKLCAGRIGQVLNFSSLANDVGVAVNTIRNWMSILEASYIVFLLPLFFENFGKRLIKSPKLYFYDSGLAAAILGIERPDQLLTHFARGHLFEGMVISEALKSRFNRGLRPNAYFWRDSNHCEVDLVLDEADGVRLTEIKSGSTFSTDQVHALRKVAETMQVPPEHRSLIYGGPEELPLKDLRVIPWKIMDQSFFRN